MSESEMIQAIISGNKQLYADIVRQYQQIVANLAYKLAGDSLDIEEVTQQVFVELYSALPRFRNEAKLSTFIYRITVNVVSKMSKASRRYFFSSTDVTFDTPSGDRNAEQTIIRSETQRRMQNAIGRLKPEQRTAIVLYTYDEFSYQQIADVMQVSLAKVESLIFRAKKKLREYMEQ